ncbi:putative nuclease HARBI1 [Diadema setosum]|uniref:putative nuclease HARBI1 n=1 Tax=Diadema setosum TaxID=31175 RepID=UPI003B3B9284
MAYLMLVHRGLRRERVFRDRLNPLDCYDDTDLFKKYRFNRGGIMHIIDNLAGQLEHRTNRSHAVPASLQVFIALRFYATGSVLDNSAAMHGISVATCSRVVRRVTKALCQRRNEYIKFPCTREDVRNTQVKFHNIAQFPHVVGVVDGTHVCLSGAPLGEEEYVYVNRKGRHSINVQIISNAEFKITNIVARWPGSTHDSRILQNSIIGQKFANGTLEGILLGDSGYALHPWLMTPVLNPDNRAQRAYNQSHSRTRATVEQVNGQLKNKFRCLIGQGLQMSPIRAGDVIVACAVLHNISKDLHQPDVQFHMEEDHDWQLPLEHAPCGAAARARLIEYHFM